MFANTHTEYFRSSKSISPTDIPFLDQHTLLYYIIYYLQCMCTSIICFYLLKQTRLLLFLSRIVVEVIFCENYEIVSI